jgi:pyrroloquinoline quinone biosynthesis protein B
MRIEILGSAAGGGFPQWNCACQNCQALRAGNFPGKSRTQTQVAVSDDSNSWFLLNASPDLRMQIEATPALHPNHGTRSSPIAGVVLTGADLDQITGLLSLRELQPFRICCTPSLRRILQEDNAAFGMLNRIPDQVVWTEIKPGKSFELAAVDGQGAGLGCESFSIGKRYPIYVGAKAGRLAPEEASLGLKVTSGSGRCLLYLPAVAEMDDALLRRMETADAILFDGTFWSDDELIRVQGSGATAREMGHLPISSPDGSLKKLAGLRKPRKIFIHVNNTNPMLNEAGAEYHEVRAAGWEVAEDGWRIDL